jgi:hypothetical protein
MKSDNTLIPWCVVTCRVLDLVLFCLTDLGQSVATPIEMEDCACHICGKVLRRTSLRRHIVDRHFPSRQAPCQLCGKVFKTANSLSTHMNAFHKHFKKLPAASSHTWMPFIDSSKKSLLGWWSIWWGHVHC